MLLPLEDISTLQPILWYTFNRPTTEGDQCFRLRILLSRLEYVPTNRQTTNRPHAQLQLKTVSKFIDQSLTAFVLIFSAGRKGRRVPQRERSLDSLIFRGTEEGTG